MIDLSGALNIGTKLPNETWKDISKWKNIYLKTTATIGDE